jgi:hypothetical protein
VTSTFGSGDPPANGEVSNQCPHKPVLPYPIR